MCVYGSVRSIDWFPFLILLIYGTIRAVDLLFIVPYRTVLNGPRKTNEINMEMCILQLLWYGTVSVRYI